MNEPTQSDAASTVEAAIQTPSRWWMLYHFWAGLCVKTFLDISGLATRFLPAQSPSEASHDYAARYAFLSTIVIIGAVIVGYYASKWLVSSVQRSALAPTAKRAVTILLPFAYFAGVIVLAMIFGPMLESASAKTRAESPSTSLVSPPASTSEFSGVAPVTTLATIQSAEGVTDADLDQTALGNLESWIKETTLKKTIARLKETGAYRPGIEPALITKSVYVVVADKKLAVVRMSINDAMRSVTILGIKGSELHQVHCLRTSNHDIPIWSGECGQKITEVFSVSVRP